jgi:hypothetical protein
MSAWRDAILDTPTARDAWARLFEHLAEIAVTTTSPVDLSQQTVDPDRLLAEAAWGLWHEYPVAAPRTVDALKDWWKMPSGQGKVVLILDALSLRELPAILSAAESRKITPTSVKITGAEVPSDTDTFAQALGLPGRNDLKNNAAPGTFAFTADSPWTEVFSIAFADCVPNIAPYPNLFVWHTWLDDLIHLYAKAPDQVFRLASAGIQGDDFWRFLDRLRTGRRLIITADHGYALSRSFITEEDPQVVSALREAFGASRNKPAKKPWALPAMPPVAWTENGQNVVIGQRKWSAPGGFPYLCHGGLSLLEVAVPFVELPALQTPAATSDARPAA